MVKKKILIVDDESFIREMLDLQLKDEGYDVIQATSGKEGLEKTKKEKRKRRCVTMFTETERKNMF